MSTYQNRRVSFVSLAGLLLCGCSLISFGMLDVKVWPQDHDAVLLATESPWVEFPESPDRASAQRLFSISSPVGQVSGDFRWDGRRLYFDAAPAFNPGVRYVLTYRGRVTLENGESFDANKEVPFFVGHAGAGPQLLWCNLSDGQVVATLQELVLRFTQAIDPGSFAREFELQPSSAFTIAWNAMGDQATISPKDAWTNLATYTWSLGKALTAPDGTPAGIEYSGGFRVQLDSMAPRIDSIVPALRSTLTAIPGTGLDDIRADDALLLAFSEDVLQDTLLSAFSLTPPVQGSWVRTGPGVFAFTPGSRWTMDQEYVLRVAATVQDLSGNKLSLPYQVKFTPRIPVQSVQSIKAVYASSENEWTAFNTLDAKAVTLDVEGSLRLTIQFAEAFEPQSAAKFVSGIVFDGYFPSSLTDPSLLTVQWSGGNLLSLRYTSLEKSASVSNFYKLTLPGGPALSDNGSGSFLKEDVWLYFVTNQ